MNKATLRKQSLSRRKALGEEEKAKRSRRICDHLLSWTPFLEARSVAMYAPIHGEVDLQPLFETLQKKEVRIAFPRIKIIDNFPTIELVWVSSLSGLSEGFRQIPEPVGESVVSPSDIDLFLVPAVAFDQDSFRLGYGGGSYDHLLAQASSSALKVGVAFGIQICENLPKEKHDIPMDAVFTESGIQGPH